MNLKYFTMGCFALLTAASAIPVPSIATEIAPLEKRIPGRPSAIGYQFYRSTSNLLQWAVLGVSTPELRPGNSLRFDIASTAAILVAETRTHCIRAGFTVGYVDESVPFQ